MFSIIGSVYVSAKSAMVMFRASTVRVVMLNEQSAGALLWGTVCHKNIDNKGMDLLYGK